MSRVKNSAGLREGFETPQASERVYQNVDNCWWKNPITSIFITIVLAIADGLVLHSALDEAMTQSEALGLIMALTIAILLNFIPLVVSHYLHMAVDHTYKHAVAYVIAGMVIFTLLYIPTVVLRFAYMDSYGESNKVTLTNMVTTRDGEYGSIITGEDGLQYRLTYDEEGNVIGLEPVVKDLTAEEEARQKKAFAIVLLLSLEPLATSVVNFLIGYLCNDPLMKEINQLRLRKLELLEEASILAAALLTLDQNKQRELDVDEAKFIATIREVDARSDVERARSRMLLAEELKDPSATSMLADEAMNLQPTTDDVTDAAVNGAYHEVAVDNPNGPATVVINGNAGGKVA